MIFCLSVIGSIYKEDLMLHRYACFSNYLLLPRLLLWYVTAHVMISHDSLRAVGATAWNSDSESNCYEMKNETHKTIALPLKIENKAHCFQLLSSKSRHLSILLVCLVIVNIYSSFSMTMTLITWPALNITWFYTITWRCLLYWCCCWWW